MNTRWDKERLLKVIVYIDVLFLINFMMDFFILWVVKCIYIRKVSNRRILLGALVGAILMCLLLFVPSKAQNIALYILISLIMVKVAFKTRSLKDYLKLVGVTYLVAITLGGAGIFLFYYTRIGGILGNYLLFQLRNLSIGLLLASIAVCYALIKVFMYYYGRYILRGQKRFEMTISLLGEEKTLVGLVDTGHSLCDPTTGYPVIVVEKTLFHDMLPTTSLADLQGDVQIDELRLIPFSSLGRDNGFLLGFSPDKVTLMTGKAGLSYSEVVIGLTDKKLAKDGSYQALIHPILVP